MRDLNKDTFGGKTGKKNDAEHPECGINTRDTKVLASEKSYTVTVSYIHLTDEEAKVKLAIIESIIRKGYQK